MTNLKRQRNTHMSDKGSGKWHTTMLRLTSFPEIQVEFILRVFATYQINKLESSKSMVQLSHRPQLFFIEAKRF